ncbi:MAG TPA: hypothetical protein VKN99_27785 [Polyangia bacterium]|nr:hypothetical protein [Polyangia bacterium]
MRRALLAGLLAALPAPALAGRVGSAIVDVSPSFRPGPYSAITIDPVHPERIVVGTHDGHVLWTLDGGLTAMESQALSPREYMYMTLRGANSKNRSYAGTQRPRGGDRLFMNLLNEGLPVARWALWMALENNRVDVNDIALSPSDGRLVLATPSGIWISDDWRGVWSRTMGPARPKEREPVGFAVAIDPRNRKFVLAGTAEGILVSHDGGLSFRPHPNRKLAEQEVHRFIWDPEDNDHILALTAEGTVLQSKDHGKSFEEALSAGSEINAVALAPEGAYIATKKGLLAPGPEGEDRRLFKDQSVVGVVPVGEGVALVATETALMLLEPDGGMGTLMRTTLTDPFQALVGTSDLAWALTRFGIFRIGATEDRAPARAPHPPKIKLSLEELQHAVISHMHIGDPQDTRLAPRWYADLLPTLTVRVKGVVEHGYNLTYDYTLPLPFRYAGGWESTSCCGGVPGEPPVAVVVLLSWDLSRVVFGQASNVSMPYTMIEQNLRPIKETVLGEVRWRYRECAHLAMLLEHPPENPTVELFWRLRLEEHASYLEALSGRDVVAFGETEKVP